MNTKETDQMYADFGKMVIERLSNGDTSGLQEAARELKKQVAFIGSKFKEHDTAFALMVDWIQPQIIECEVTDIKIAQSGDTWYYLFEKNGRRVGNIHESMLFATAKECAEFYRDFCEKQLVGIPIVIDA